jgi:DNA-directed RNA polymerase specialized sigma subunit
LRAKEYLQKIGKYDMLIKNKLVEKQRWNDIALGITPQMNGERVQSSGNQQKMACAIERMIDIERELDEYIDRLIDTRNEVLSVIEQLDKEEYDFLHLVYVQHFTLGEVANMKNYSYSWATSFHGKALKGVQKILDAKSV